MVTHAEFVATNDDGFLWNRIVFCVDSVDVIFENGKAWVGVEQLGLHEKAAKQGQYHDEENGAPDGGQVEGENGQKRHEE